MNYSRRIHNYYSKYITSQRSKPCKFCKIAWYVHIGTASITPWACVTIATTLSVAATEPQLVHIPINLIMPCNVACNVISALNY